MVISREERNLEFLKTIVKAIYQVFKNSEYYIHAHYPEIKPLLPERIFFIHSEELEEQYPDLDPEEREDAICREHGAVFIIGIGAPLKNGHPHDGRAPDYDDWITPTEKGLGLNGDIIVLESEDIENRIQEIRVKGIVERAGGSDERFRDSESTRKFLNNLETNEADQPVTLLKDLQILKDAGLKDVSVFWLEYREVVYGGRKTA